MMKFLNDERGNFGLIFAIMLLPLTLAVGMALDVGLILTSKQQLDAAADAAVLSVLSPASPNFTQAILQVESGEVPGGDEQIKRLLRANLQGGPDLSDLDLKPTFTKADNILYSEIVYSAKVNLNFGGLIGYGSQSIEGAVRAQTTIGSPTDFHVLLDNTPSMGVGATLSDIQTLIKNTPDRCAFACHQMDRWNDNYRIAKTLGVQMRIDVVRQATQRLTETIETVRQVPDQFRMAVYSFGKRAESMGLAELAPLSSDMKTVRDQTAALDLMTIPYQNYNFDQLTAFDDTLKSVRKTIPEKGKEKKHGTRRQILFFVSDGVNDAYKPVGCKKLMTGTRCQEPIDIKSCDQIKQRGVEIAVLYTTYLPLPKNAWYNTWIRPFENEIGPSMKECASSGLYFEVSPTEGIEEAMQALLMKTISQPRLMN